MSGLASYYDRLARSGRAVETPRHSSCAGLGRQPRVRGPVESASAPTACDRGPQLLLTCASTPHADMSPNRVVLPEPDPPVWPSPDSIPLDLVHAEVTW